MFCHRRSANVIEIVVAKTVQRLNEVSVVINRGTFDGSC